MKRILPNQKERIAIYLPDLEVGGEQRILVNLAGELAEEDYQVDFIVVYPNGALQKTLSPKVNLIQVNTPVSISMFYLIRYLRVNRPKILLSSLEMTNLIAIIAAKLSRVPSKIVIRIAVAVSIHKRTWWKKRLEKVLLQLFYPYADEIITVSDGVKADLVEYARLNKENLTTIYNPIVNPTMLENAEEVDGNGLLRELQGHPIVLGVGRFTDQKDFKTLIRAFSQVNPDLSARLVILGDGPERAGLEKIVDELKLHDTVQMPGFLQNPYPFFRAASVFVLSSRWEGLPSVLIEALALGCPIVSTDCRFGPNEILANGKYGEIVPIGDAKKMSEAIERVITGSKRNTVPDAWIARFTMETNYPQTKRLLGL